MPGKPLKVRWLKRALANLEAEAEYISRDSHAAAQRVVKAIEQAVQLLASHTALGRAGRVEGTTIDDQHQLVDFNRQLLVPPISLRLRVSSAMARISTLRAPDLILRVTSCAR